MSQTYSNVDQSADPAEAVGWQERMAEWPAVVAYKHRTHALLGDAQPVLDVGSGPGHDLVALGVERSIGVDASQAMCGRATERGAVAVRSDAAALPFLDSAFGGGRADRTFQHLAAPGPALQELLRVVRPGAPVVIADPDQRTLLLQVPGVRPSVLDRLVALRRDEGYRHGCWIAHAPALLEELGATVTSVEAYPLVLRDPADAFGLPSWPHLWREIGAFNDDELAEWDAAIHHAGRGFIYCVTFLVVAATKR